MSLSPFSRRHVLAATALLSGLIALPVAAQQTNAAAVHQRALVLDGHADVLLPETPKRYFLPDGSSRSDIDKLIKGGVDAVVFSVAVGPGPRDAAGVAAARAEADRKLALIKKLATDNPSRVGIALTPDEVLSLNKAGRIAVIIGFQNARSLGDDINQIDALYKDGVRVFAFNHAGHNSWSDSSRPSEGEPVAEHRGLSPIGRQAVAKLNDLGVLIDVSQLSEDALLQTVQLSRAPVVATHSNVRALIDNTRNLSDAELDAIKAKGGVVQVTPFNAYLKAPDASQRPAISAVRTKHGLPSEFKAAHDGYGTLKGAAQQAFLDELAPLAPKATVADFVNHIDYIARRIGWEHVGIGTDFDHGSGVTGFDSQAEAPNVTAEFLRRGYSEAQIDAIWSGNFLRVWRQAQSLKR